MKKRWPGRLKIPRFLEILSCPSNRLLCRESILWSYPSRCTPSSLHTSCLPFIEFLPLAAWMYQFSLSFFFQSPLSLLCNTTALFLLRHHSLFLGFLLFHHQLSHFLSIIHTPPHPVLMTFSESPDIMCMVLFLFFVFLFASRSQKFLHFSFFCIYLFCRPSRSVAYTSPPFFFTNIKMKINNWQPFRVREAPRNFLDGIQVVTNKGSSYTWNFESASRVSRTSRYLFYFILTSLDYCATSKLSTKTHRQGI